MDNSLLIETGIELCQKGKFLQAVEFFQAAIENEPNKEEAYLLLADAYEGMGRINKAKSIVYQLLSIDPTNKKAIEKIKSLDKENCADDTVIPGPTRKDFTEIKVPSYKVEMGRGRAADCDFYIRFDGGGEVLFNVEGSAATVTGCRGRGLKELFLPKMVKFNGMNYSVVRINEEAFSIKRGVYGIKKAVLPDSMLEIGNGAFSYSNLEQIELPNSLTKIGDEAFYGCDSLKEIVIPDSVVEIGKRCFGCCRCLESIKISANVSVLKDEAFWHCDSLKSVDIPEGVVEIGKDCFRYSNLETVTIPASVKVIKEGAFYKFGSKGIEFKGFPPKDWESGI